MTNQLDSLPEDIVPDLLRCQSELGSTRRNILQASENLDLDSRPPRPLVTRNVQHPQSDDGPRPLDDDLNPRLKEHTGAELALVSLSTLTYPSGLIVQSKTGLLGTITLSIACSDKAQDHLQICQALGILRPISLVLHFGAALTTCAILFIPQNGGDTISFRCLRVFCEYISIIFSARTNIRSHY